jgi:hypothetical protein
LERATLRCERRLGISDFRNVTEAGLLEMRHDRPQKATTRLSSRSESVTPYRHPGFNERPKQPRPDSALMVDGVAFCWPALVAPRVAWVIRRQRSQPERCQQTSFDGINNLPSTVVIDQRKRQPANGQDLIGTERRVLGPCLVIDVDDVCKIAVVIAPVPSTEGGKTTRELVAPVRLDLRRDP